MNAVLHYALPNYNWLEDKIRAIQQNKHDQETETNTNPEKASVQSNLVRFEVLFDPTLGITLHRINDSNQTKPPAIKERAHVTGPKLELISEKKIVSITKSNTPKPYVKDVHIIPNAHEYEIYIKNVVTTFNVGCLLNLQEIALKGQNVEFNKARTNIIIMRLKNSLAKATAYITKSGKITCFGTKSEKQAKIAARQFARLLQKLGFNTRFRNYRIINVLGVTKFPFCINLEKFYKSNCHNMKMTYEQEIHPWVKCKTQEPIANLKVYHTGSIIVNASDITSVQRAVEFIYPLVNDHSKEKRNQKTKTSKSHSVIGTYQCDFRKCNYQASYKIGLQRHKESTHHKLRSACNFCDKTYTTWSNLNKHMKKKHNR